MHRRQGFTLLEIAVTIVVLGIVLPLLIIPLTNLLQSGASLELLDQAAILADSQVEKLQQQTFAQIQSISPANPPSPYEHYQLEQSVDYVQGPFDIAQTTTNATGYKRVIVTVTTPEGYAYSLTTLVTDHEL